MKFLKKTSTALGLSLAVLANVAIADAPETVAADTLTIGMEISYPPFESYNEKGEVVGLDPELAKLLAGKMHLANVDFKDNVFTSLILDLQAQKYDAIISGMYVTPEREEKALAIPYAKTGALIIVSADSEIEPQVKEDLCGLKVGLQSGTVWVKALQELSDGYCKENNAGEIQVLEFPTGPETAQALISGNIQAELEIAAAAQAFAEKSRDRIKITSPDLVYPQTLGIYVHKDNQALYDALLAAMAEIKADGSYHELLATYELTPIEDK